MQSLSSLVTFDVEGFLPVVVSGWDSMLGVQVRSLEWQLVSSLLPLSHLGQWKPVGVPTYSYLYIVTYC